MKFLFRSSRQIGRWLSRLCDRVAKFFREKRLDVTGGCKMQPHWATLRSHREVKSEERAAQSLMGDELRHKRVVLARKAIGIAVRKVARLQDKVPKEAPDQCLMRLALFWRQRQHIAIKQKRS